MKWFTTRQLAEILGTEEWRVRRLFEDGTLPEPARFGGKRAISPQEIPVIVDALRGRGWISAAHVRLPEPDGLARERQNDASR